MTDGGEKISVLLTVLSLGLRAMLALLVLGAGVAVAAHWMSNRPRAQRRKPPRKATLVQVTSARVEDHPVTVKAMGTVEPAREVELKARVLGEIVQVAPVFAPGGRFEQGEQILTIEPDDYELALRQRRSDLARARSDLKQELGRQDVARREYELLGEDVQEEEEDLLLRQPQLAMYRAAVDAAQAALEKAELDLERTVITAPFNAAVREQRVDLGSQVSTGTVLAHMVGTDEYWVEVSVPIGQLQWIQIPGFNSSEGSSVRVYHESAWGPDAHREGRVVRLKTNLEPRGRMAQILVRVEDPLALGQPPRDRRALILGSYVRVEVEGRAVTDAVRVPRTALRDGDHVWTMDEDASLRIHRVEITWSTEEYVLVRDGIASGDRIITSDLGAPVEGMKLRLPGQGPGKRSSDGQGAGGEEAQ